MDPDLFFVIGLICIGFCIPAIISAFSEGRPPRAAAILLVIGGGLIGIALFRSPVDYTVAMIPDIFAGVVDKYIR